MTGVHRSNGALAAITRRGFLLGAIGTLPMTSRGVHAKTRHIAWAPDTPCGMNIEYNEFWARRVAPNQGAISATYCCSFVRAMYFCFEQGRFKPDQLDAAVQTLSGARVALSGGDSIELSAGGFSYELAPGEVVVLSKDVNCGGLTLPARQKLTVLAGRPAKFAADGTLLSQALVTISAPGARDDSVVASTPDTLVLHANFYRSLQKPRRPIANYVAQASAWMDNGFGFIHGGYHNAWQKLRAKFGSSIDDMRRQEWLYFSNVNWDAKLALITDENEPVWPGESASDRWRNFRDYFRNTLYPQMREIFPKHTLGFGFPYYSGMHGLEAMDWWPDDDNVLLRIHGYLRGTGNGEIDADGRSPAELFSVFSQVKKQQERLKVRQICWEEFGLPDGVDDRSERLGNFRRVIESFGWPYAVWGGSTHDRMRTMSLENEVWIPLPDAAGAFACPAKR